MHWHTLAFAAIPVWVFAIGAAVKPVLEVALEGDEEWWGGFPLAFAGLITGIVGGGFGAIAIGFYAATGISPFA